MRNEMVFRGSRIAVFATVMFTSATLFASQLISIAPNEGGDHFLPIQPVSDNVGGNPSVPDPDGTWIFNTNGTLQLWSNSANWAGGIIADGGGKADFSTLNITGARAVQVDTARTVGRLDIGDTDNLQSYTMSAAAGVSLTFDNTANSADAQLNETAGSGGDTISAPLILNSTLDVTNASPNTLALSGAISGVGGLKSASGTVALGGSLNTYGGGTTISGGKITISGTGTPLGSGSTLTLSGGTLEASASRSAGSALAMNVVVTADSAITTTSAAATNTQRFTGTLTGTGGTLTLRNDAAATTNLFDVIFSGGDYTMSRPIVLDNGAGGGTVRFSDFGAAGTTHTYSGVISGNGAFNRSTSSGAAGLTVFTATNTYTGPTTISNSTLQLGSGGSTGSLSASSAISLSSGGTFKINRNNTVLQGTDFSSSAITGVGKFEQAGSGSTTLNVANTYSGGTIISGGTLIATANGAFGSGGINLNAASVTLTLQGGVNPDFISNAATLTIGFTSDSVNLNYTGTEVVGGLIIAGSPIAAGTYSSADFAEFAGTGTITVVPEPTTWGMLVLGGGLLTAVRRFRRKQI